MNSPNIDKLKRIQLREVWKHEAHDFTQWLEENLDVLNSSIDLKIVNVDREQSTGAFSVDLVGEDDEGRTVIIENQLEKSDHDHLGKLITYLTSMNAKIAIWIVSHPRPEHVTAVAWLNESSSADFYMVKVEAVRIGNSPAAPLFTLIVGPSAEARELGQTKKNIAERYVMRQRWWATLIPRSAAVTKLHAHLSPRKSAYLKVNAGITGTRFTYSIWEHKCAAQFFINRKHLGDKAEVENRKIFDYLYSQRHKIETAVDSPIEWEKLEGKPYYRIRIFQDGGRKSPEESWPEIQDSIIKKMDRLERALKPLLKRLKDT